MGKLKLRPWDSAEHLKSEEDIVFYLEACMEEGDSSLIAHALGVIARARQQINVEKGDRSIEEG